MYIIKHKFAHLFYDHINKVFRLYNDCDYLQLFKGKVDFENHVRENKIQNAEAFPVFRVIIPGERPFDDLDLYMVWATAENKSTILKNLKVNLKSEKGFRTVHNARLLMEF